MTRALVAALAFAVIVGSWAFGSRGSATRDADSAVVRGVSLGLFATDPEWDYGPLVREISARGATDVLVVVNAYQSHRLSSDIAPRPGFTPSRATVARTLAQVRASGMRAALMPVVRLTQRGPNEWRGTIAPADGLDAWFDSYRAFVLPLAELAEASGATRFVVGSELSSLEPYDAHWRSVIEAVRARFSGRLTYSANWDRLSSVHFWDALDEVGVTAYFPLVRGDVEPTDETLARAWRGPREALASLRARTGKPLFLTEVGYPSHAGAAARPWDETHATSVDLALQRRLYDAFCDAFVDAQVIDGFYVWNWFGFGGPLDTTFTPRGKPAAAALATCFARPFRMPIPQEMNSHER